MAGVVALVAGCSEAGIQLIPEPPPQQIDDLLVVTGSVCTSPPEEVQFPVKIVLIVDSSGSMQFTDPSDRNLTSTVASDGTNWAKDDANGSVKWCEDTCARECPKDPNPQACLTQCTTNCNNPVNPGRQEAAQALIDRFRNNPAVSFAIVRFNGRITINAPDDKSDDEFTRSEAALNAGIISLAQADITTDYQGALTATYQLLEKDMLRENPVDRARTKYVIVFLSDGGPNPQCQEGCGNDKQTLAPGVIVDSWCDVPRKEWCDNFYVNYSGMQERCEDMQSWYPHLEEPCKEYNSDTDIKQKVLEIMSLGDQYGVGEITLNTAFLFVPSLPQAVQELMGVQGSSNAACTADADCPVAEEACMLDGPSGVCKGPSEQLLMDMATWGRGLYRNFTSGQKIDFLSFNYSAVSRPFGMTNFIVTNTNVLPGPTGILTDSDGDGLPDSIDDITAGGSDVRMADSDCDGYNDKLEYELLAAGFDPMDPSKPEMACPPDFPRAGGGCERHDWYDDDGDGLNACEEKVLGTDPKIADTDRDRFPDGLEFHFGSNPLVPDDKSDYDYDGKLTGEEIRIHSNPTIKDEAVQATYKYIYEVSDQPPRPDLRKCYDFTVRHIRLRETVDQGRAGTVGYNHIMVYFGEGPADDPRDYGNFQAACVRAQYVTDSYKFPADGRVKLKPEDFQPLHLLMGDLAQAKDDPRCGKIPPDEACPDPCKGALMP